MPVKHTETNYTVTASELAQMGVCERLIVFEHRFGKRASPERQQAMRRGTHVHQEFYQEGVNAQVKRGHCYIAGFIFGESPETTYLRNFRDQVLRQHILGRGFIKAYYHFAPNVCNFLQGHPRAIPPLRTLLRIAISGLRFAARALESMEDRHLPKELSGAELAYAEQTFRAKGQVTFIAKCDRAYRHRNGEVILLELKTRHIDRPYLSDQIELSVQRLAIMAQTGEDVADYGFVLVKVPGANTQTYHRVRLFPIAEVEAFAHRRERLISNLILGQYAHSHGICAKCSYLKECCPPRQKGK